MTELKELIAEMGEAYEKLTGIEREEVLKGLSVGDVKVVSNPTAASVVKKMIAKEKKMVKKEAVENVSEKGEEGKELAKASEVAIVEKRDMTMAEIMTVSENLYKSRYWNSVQSKEQALAKVLAGRERGFGITTSLSKFYVVNGNVGTSAEIMGAMVRRSKEYDFLIVETTDKCCRLKFTKNGQEIPDAYKGVVSFTIDEARKANLIRPGSGWEKYPSDMLFARALSRGSRRYCQHLIQGTYLTEEIGGSEDNHVSDIVVEAEVVSEKKDNKPVDVVEVKPEPPSRETLLQGLVEKYSKETIKKCKDKLKIEGSLKVCNEIEWQKLIKELEK